MGCFFCEILTTTNKYLIDVTQALLKSPPVILECHLCLEKFCWVKESIRTLSFLIIFFFQRNKKTHPEKTRTKTPIEFCHATTDSPHSTMAQFCMPRCLVFDSSITLRSLRGFKKLGKGFFNIWAMQFEL